MSFIQNLQNKPKQTKSRIILSVFAISVLVSIGFLINTIQAQLSGLEKNDIIPEEFNTSILSTTDYITIEAMETKNDKKYIHFKIENNTSDILNFSTPDQIEIRVGNNIINVEELKDRQNLEFYKKVLSNTTAYGTVIVPDFEPEDGSITFDGLYFEKTATNIFKEKIDVDFTQLKSVEELRS